MKPNDTWMNPAFDRPSKIRTSEVVVSSGTARLETSDAVTVKPTLSMSSYRCSFQATFARLCDPKVSDEVFLNMLHNLLHCWFKYENLFLRDRLISHHGKVHPTVVSIIKDKLKNECI